jgi:hypothetical protein
MLKFIDCLVMCPFRSLGVNILAFDVLGCGTLAKEDTFIGIGIGFHGLACRFLGGDGASVSQHAATQGFEFCECLAWGGVECQVVGAVV